MAIRLELVRAVSNLFHKLSRSHVNFLMVHRAVVVILPLSMVLDRLEHIPMRVATDLAIVSSLVLVVRSRIMRRAPSIHKLRLVSPEGWVLKERHEVRPSVRMVKFFEPMMLVSEFWKSL